MKYLLFLLMCLSFSAAKAEENIAAPTADGELIANPLNEDDATQEAEDEENESADAVEESADKNESEDKAETEGAPEEKPEPVVVQNVFPQQFINALHKCQPAVAQNQQDAADAPAIILGAEDGACRLKYGDFNLFLPFDILPNLHGFDDLQILLKNPEITHFDYQPQYVYDGLLHAMNACHRGTNYFGVEKKEDHGEIHAVSSLEAEYVDEICTIYLVSELEIEGAVTDYTVTCKIGAQAVAGLMNYYRDLLEKYGERRVVEDGKPKVISEKENDETRQADAELMYFLQQKGYCKRPILRR